MRRIYQPKSPFLLLLVISIFSVTEISLALFWRKNVDKIKNTTDNGITIITTSSDMIE